MKGIFKITTNGRITIPRNLRQLLEVKPGDKISFESDFPTQSIKIKKYF